MNRLPNVIFVGPMKSGTSWMQDYLTTRPDVLLPKGVKETHFYDRRFDRGLNWYKAHFPEGGLDTPVTVVEVAPSYFHCAEAPSRISETLDGVVVFVLLREPVARAWSHYLHLQRKGYTTLPLSEAILEYQEILEASRYSKRLPEWGAIFGVERVKVLFFEHLARDPESFAKNLCVAMNLTYHGLPEQTRGKSNEAGVAPSATLARFGRQVAEFIRSRRLYFLINVAKRLGLKSLFFGRPGGGGVPRLDGADRTLLEGLLADERVIYERLLAEHQKYIGASLTRAGSDVGTPGA